MTIKKFIGSTVLVVLLSAGCNKNPFDRTHDASNSGGTGTFTPSTSFVIFNSELTSGGGAFEYPGPEGQSLTFNDMSNPVSHRSIRYSWTGQPVSNAGCPAQNPTSAFAGFDLMHTSTQGDYAGTPGRDLTKAGYTKVTFYARGSLSTNTYLKVEVAGPGSTDPCAAVVSPCLKLLNGADPKPSQDTTCSPVQLSGQWGTYTVTIPSPATQLAAVKDLFKATFIYIPTFGAPSGQGGTAYFDVIQYQP